MSTVLRMLGVRLVEGGRMRQISNLETSCSYAIGPGVVKPEEISPETLEMVNNYRIPKEAIISEREVDAVFDKLRSPLYKGEKSPENQPLTRYFRLEQERNFASVDGDIETAVEDTFGRIVRLKVESGYTTQILPRPVNPVEYANAAQSILERYIYEQ